MIEIAEIERQVLVTVEATGIPYQRLDCDPDFADTAAFCERYGYPLGNVGNTILVAGKKLPRMYCACVLTATDRLDVNNTVRTLMHGKRVSFARPADALSVTGMLIGGVTAFGLPRDIPIFVDEAIMNLDYIILGSGSRSSKIKTTPEIFRHLKGATIVSHLSIA